MARHSPELISCCIASCVLCTIQIRDSVSLHPNKTYFSWPWSFWHWWRGIPSYIQKSQLCRSNFTKFKSDRKFHPSIPVNFTKLKSDRKFHIIRIWTPYSDLKIKLNVKAHVFLASPIRPPIFNADGLTKIL